MSHSSSFHRWRVLAIQKKKQEEKGGARNGKKNSERCIENNSQCRKERLRFGWAEAHFQCRCFFPSNHEIQRYIYKRICMYICIVLCFCTYTILSAWSFISYWCKCWVIGFMQKGRFFKGFDWITFGKWVYFGNCGNLLYEVWFEFLIDAHF